MRYERKYRLEGVHPEVVRQVLRNHPASFRKTYPDRQINNIYFDTASLIAYQENVDGVPQRRKFRVRWYASQIEEIKNPTLEIKIKDNLLGTKKSYAVDDFSLDDLQALSKTVSNHSELNLTLLPTLINSYQRSYYESFSGKFRMTIDWNLSYFSLLSARRFTRYNLSDSASILEIKYEQKYDDIADDIFRFIPFRYSKSSKYVTGMQLANF